MKIAIVVLAGGLGTRLKESIPERTPKILAEVNGRPFIEYLLRQLHGVVEEYSCEIVFSLGHLGHQVASYLEANKIACSYYIEEKRLGTLGGVSNEHSQYECGLLYMHKW